MSLAMVYFLFCIMFVYKQECAVIRLNHRNRNAFEYVIQKYVNPLRRLSADLPNHAIEMEIEIHGPAPTEATQNPRRLIRIVSSRPPKSNMRSMDEAEGGEAPPVPDVAATTVAATDLPQSQSSTAPVASPAGPAAPGSEDPSRIPVFMEDLKKALDDLEKRLITNTGNPTTMPPTNNNTPSPTGGGPTTQMTNSRVRSIDDIVQILKKAVHVEHRMPKPGDKKLEWVQIKIPKSMRL